MKKETSRDYATAAFARWAIDGRPSHEMLRDELLQFMATRSSGPIVMNVIHAPGRPTEASILSADKEEGRRRGYFLDMQTVDRVVHVLEGLDYALFLERVYFAEPNTVFERGEISRRVVAASMQAGISERTVYQRLREARDLFCIMRGITFGYF